MKVSEFVNKYSIFLRYAADRTMINRNSENEILTYIVCASGQLDYGSSSWTDEKKSYSYGFIYKSKRKMIGIINGQRVEAKFAYNFIKQMEIVKQFDAELIEKELTLEAL